MQKRKRKPRRVHPLHKEAQEHIGHAITLMFNMNKSGETATEFAARAGINTKTFYHARRGDKPVSVATLASIAIALDVPMQELVPGYKLGSINDA